jgi:hypothetical protein
MTRKTQGYSKEFKAEAVKPSWVSLNPVPSVLYVLMWVV